MTSGWLFLAIAALICVACFLNGLCFVRMPEEKLLDGRTQVEIPQFLARGRTRVQQARLHGRVMMIAAPAFLLFFAALCFGLFGPVQGIQTIQL